MTVTCPRGHTSATTDYCDQCGASLQVAAQPTEVLPALEEPETAAAATPEPCPKCATPRSGDDSFCEACGFDFAAPVPAAVEATDAPPTGTAVWEVVVSADRQRFERCATADLAFPGEQPHRSFPLDRPEVNVGRSRAGQDGAVANIELDDPAISRLHAVFVRQAGGSYAVVDLGSTNGTTVNDDPKPIDPHVPVPLADGDRVGVGAWTTVTIRGLRNRAARAAPHPAP
jgi:hypothetical protein